MTKVLKIVPSDFVNETRDLREVSAIGEHSYDVKVIAVGSDGLDKKLNYEYFELERLELGVLNHSASALQRILRYLFFSIKAIKYGVAYQPDIISGQDFTGLLIGYFIKRKNKGYPRLLYDSHELGTHISSNLNYTRLIVLAKRFIEKVLIKKADAVMVVSESIAEYIKRDCNLDKKPTVVRNVPPYQPIAIKPNTYREIFNIDSDKHILLYQGNLGVGRGVDTIIRVLTKLEESYVLVIMGNGKKEDYIQLINELDLQGRVFFQPAVPYEKLIEFTSSADMGIMLLDNICLSYYYALPNKLFEYIQFELPVVCSDFPDIKRVINDYNVGETVSPENLDDISSTIKEIFENKQKLELYKENTKHAKAELNWEKEQSILLRLYRVLAESH
ncbi:MAG: glycosyltransferase family 4 protein [Syntrophomonas sp.]